MTIPFSYNKQEYKDMLCLYVQALHNSLPPHLRSEISEAYCDFCDFPCGPDSDSDSSSDSDNLQAWLDARQPLTITDIGKILPDPWFAWIMEGECSLAPHIAADIFNETPIPSVININPIVETSGYTSEQLGLLRDLGGFYHYLFARTYYIDRCYGTNAYISYYYNGSEEAFQNDHISDFDDYVDATGMIKGNILLSAWQDDSAFRASLDPFYFIRSLAGVNCSDFWNWSNPNIYWWTSGKTFTGLWVDDLIMQDAWYNSSNETISVGESAIIHTLSGAPFPGYRISVNSLYQTITLPESDNLANLFGNNLQKGPTLIEELPLEQYDETCFIPPPEDSDSDSDIYSDGTSDTTSDSSSDSTSDSDSLTPTPTPTPTPTDPYDPYNP